MAALVPIYCSSSYISYLHAQVVRTDGARSESSRGGLPMVVAVKVLVQGLVAVGPLVTWVIIVLLPFRPGILPP